MGKGEIAHYEQFLLFPQCFQRAYFPEVSKGVTVWEWVNDLKKRELTLYHTNHLLHVLFDEFQNSLESLGEVLDICNDTQDILTSIEIPADVTMTTKELQILLCGLNVNETKLMEELYVGLDGLETLMDSVSKIS